jgi:peptidase inhibitor family I36/uncharacterized protein DUF4214
MTQRDAPVALAESLLFPGHQPRLIHGGFMKRTTTALVLGAACLIVVAPAYAQRWGREATPRSGVCFYENINYGGRYFCSAAGTSTSQLSSVNNDEISSIRIFGDAAVTVYRDPNFRGQSRVIDSNLDDLRSLGFNDRISSYQVDSGRGNWSRDARRYPNEPYGRGVQPNASRWTYRDAEQVVRRSYRSVLGREPDPSGLRSWTEQVINNNWTQRNLEYALRQSDEYREQHQFRRR